MTRSYLSKRRCRSTARCASGGVFDAELVESSDGFALLRVADSKESAEAFSDESGGHRWQRIPPTEKKGRVHSSTVTVAVLSERQKNTIKFDERDVVFTPTRGSGPGGQNRNKVSSAVIAKHVPSGLTVRCETERSLTQNKRLAVDLMKSKLQSAVESAVTGAEAADRRDQVGSGERGDKRRTIAEQRDEVTDHISGKRWRYRDYVKGCL